MKCSRIVPEHLLTCHSSLALAFAYIDRLIRAEDRELAVVTALSSLESRKYILENAQFDEIVYDLPYDVLADLMNRIISSSDPLTSAGLLEAFQDPEGTQSELACIQFLPGLSLMVSNSPSIYCNVFASFDLCPDSYCTR